MTYEELQEYAKTVLELEITAETLTNLKIYASLLQEWNSKINLTSIVDEQGIIEKHFLDSMLPTKIFDFHKSNLCDLGTGAGFPGMVLAILFPELKVTLVDSTSKKFLFLEEVKKQCSVKNVSFHAGRAEEMKTFRGHFDIVTARGFSALPNVLELGIPLLKVGGTLISYKGERGKEELHQSESALKKLGARFLDLQDTSLPSGDARINLLFKKESKTPARYPRPWGEIVKRSL